MAKNGRLHSNVSGLIDLTLAQDVLLMYNNILLPLRRFHAFASILEVQYSVTLLYLQQNVSKLANIVTAIQVSCKQAPAQHKMYYAENTAIRLIYGMPIAWTLPWESCETHLYPSCQAQH